LKLINNMLLNAIVFSKDRPMQLHLLLESILTNFDVEDFKLNILYKASNDEYNRGYNMVRDLFPQFTYKKEESFKEDLLSLFNESDYTVFFTDDDIVYRPIKITKDEIQNIFQISEAICFSLRLGLNTTNCYTMQRLNKLENYKTHSFYHDVSLIEPIISWKVADGTNDYTYPMSLDGHIFKTQFIKNLCELLEYNNTNLFEAMLSSLLRKLGFTGFLADAITYFFVRNPGKIWESFKDCRALSKNIGQAIMEAYIVKLQREYNVTGGGMDFIRNALMETLENSEFGN